MLPAAAVVAAYATGKTRLFNVAHARIKETDRIACMAAELPKLGVAVEELPDGLVIHGTGHLHGGTTKAPLELNGYGDHRIVMALAAAACGATGPVAIIGGEAAAVTYPAFWDVINTNSNPTVSA
jgi:3-phosphoshikimate 1-carboxyvinyltransferase